MYSVSLPDGSKAMRYVGYNSQQDFAITEVYDADPRGTHYPVAWGNTLGNAADPCKTA